MNVSEQLIVASTVVSAIAALCIAVLSFRLSEDTRRYRRTSEEQLGLLREQWKHQREVWVYFDLIAAEDRLLFICANVGQPTVYIDFGRLLAETPPIDGKQLYGFQVQTPLTSGQAIHLDVAKAVRGELERMLPEFHLTPNLTVGVKLEIYYQVFNVPQGPAFRRYTLTLSGLTWQMVPPEAPRMGAAGT